MKLNTLAVCLLLFFVYSCKSAKKTALVPKTKAYNYEHPIPFQTANYLCYYTDKKLEIDGKLDEAAWSNAEWTTDFIDIEGDLKPKPFLKTNAKMLWDDQYFYIAAKMMEPHIWAKLTKRDAVIFYDDDFEVFIDPDGDGHNYYEFEMNALNTVWDLLLLHPYRIPNGENVLDNWDINGLKSAVHIEGTLNNPNDEDAYWTVEIAFPWEALGELDNMASPPRNNDQWRINFSRVDWTMETKNGKYEKVMNASGRKPLPENNWVWSAQGRIAMHHPETWGYVQFSTANVGTKKVDFIEKEEEKIKWALWQMHFQQINYKKANKVFSPSLEMLDLPVVDLPNYTFKPRIFTNPIGYIIEVPSYDGKANWYINEIGKLWKKKK